MAASTAAPTRPTGTDRPTRVGLWLLVAGLLAGLSAMAGIPARATYGAQVSVDEPYYLLTADSIAHDGDLDISDEIAAGAFRPYHAIPLNPQTIALDEDGRELSPHDPLLSVLLAPAMALPPAVAWPAAKATLAVLAGLLAALTAWVAARRFDVAPRTAGLVVGALGASMPLSAYGTQVYPEVPAALAVMVAVAAMTSPRLRPVVVGTVVVAVIALPWLSVKYVPVAAVVAALLAVRSWRDGRRRTVLLTGGVLALAGVAYLLAHQVVYGGWTVYAAGDHFADTGELAVVGTRANPLGRARRLVGLLVDRDFGIAAWTPLWFLAPVAAVRLVRDWGVHRWTLLAPAVAGWLVATFVALTMHGWWSPGRQVVVVLPLLAVAVARVVDGLRSRLALGMVGLAGLAGVSSWLWLALEAATGGPVLVVDFADSGAPARRLLAPLLPDGRAATGADDLLLGVWAVLLLVAMATAAGLRPADLRRLPPALAGRLARRTGLVLVSLGAAAVGIGWLVSTVEADAFAPAFATVRDNPLGLLLGIGGFGLAFLLRAEAWSRVLPELSRGQALAGIHLALGGNHVLPLRLGEPLRVVSVVRRAEVEVGAATASTIALRSADVVVLLALGLVAGPTVVAGLLGPVGAVVAALVGLAGAVGTWHLARRRGAVVPGGLVLALTAVAWLLEAVLVHQVAAVFGVALSPAEAVVVLAAAIAGQLVAVAPGGVGSYEAAASAGLVAAGVALPTALAVAVGLHAVKTVYSLLAGLMALVVPAPGMLGNVRLPAGGVPRPPVEPPGPGPVVLFMPAHDEGPRVADVVARAPASVDGRPVVVAVVDDGSTDDTAVRARQAGATVVAHPTNRGLGAAVRTGLEWAVAQGASAVAFCDADGEYDPAALADLVGPVLRGDADYVAGSRFAGRIDHMRPHRRAGNLLLTRWVRWTVRQPVTDGQTGYRAFSAQAARAARIPHDYNYAQVLTVDLIAKGFAYAEVGIAYRFRQSGASFVRLGRYLRRVVPAVWRQLNPSPAPDLVGGRG